jgi:murein DD-endopeptidase MepM/ murein hydrolase activator NlpD
VLGGIALVCALGVLGGTAAEAAPTTGHATLAPTASDPTTKKKKVDASIKNLKADLDETNKTLAATYTALRATQAKIPAAQTALAAAQAAAAQAAAVNAQAEQELAVARANEAKAADELVSTKAEIDAGHLAVAQFASQLYQEQGMGQLSVAMTSSSPQEFADRLALVGTVADLQSQSMTRLATARADQVFQEAHLSALRQDSAAAQRTAAKALAAANAARDEAAAAKASLDRLAVTQRSQAAALSTQVAAEKKRIRAMKAESDRLARILAARARAARRAGRTAGAGGQGFLSPPTTLGWISSEFGWRYHPILHYSRLHAGRDYAAPCGTPIHAAADGWVISAGWGGGYGNRVVIDHGFHGGVDLSTTYNHLNRIKVWSGWVHRGDVIGWEGTTGLSNGCHLHFETRENGVPVDPRKWL